MRLYDDAIAPLIDGSYRKTYPYKVFSVYMFAYIARLFWDWSCNYDHDTQYGEMTSMRAGSVIMGAFGVIQALINVGLIGDMWGKNN
jgi:hypothetical protein